MTCRLGALLLTASNVKVLGGSVEVLEENSFWNVLHQAMYVCHFYFFMPFNIFSKNTRIYIHVSDSNQTLHKVSFQLLNIKKYLIIVHEHVLDMR